jgi:death-on-curing protein
MNYLSAEQILFLHDRLIRITGGSHGVRDLNGLLASIGRPQATFEGQDLYPDVYHKAAALIDSLIRNHPFVGGNKRTGLTAAGLFCLRNGFRLTAEQEEAAAMVLAVARGELSIAEIAAWLETHTVASGSAG